MDDTRGPQDTYKTQIKGVAYSFAPFSDDQISLVTELHLMNVTGVRLVKEVCRIFSESSTSEQWEELTNRLVAREITLEDLVTGFMKLYKRQAEAGPADDAE